MLKCAGLIYGKQVHHVDHLAPLCVLLKIPLIVTEDEVAQAGDGFYPELCVIHADYLTVAEFVVSHFDVILYSIPRDLFEEVFFFAQKLLQKKVHTLWCPHGNSDKGRSIFYMEALHKEEMALVYGKQMIDYLQEKKVFDQLKGHAIVGNYRYGFYLEHKAFYDELVQKQILEKMPKAKKLFLYAPTWQDFERSSSFFDAMPLLAKNRPADVNLLVKLHPNLLQEEDPMAHRLIEEYAHEKHILFFSDFAPIYPLLNRADVYIGDMSSIGYDFLTFDRPLFFLNQNGRDPIKDPGLYLFRTGEVIDKEHYGEIYERIEHFLNFELRRFSEVRKEVYTYAFGHKKPLEIIKTEIEKTLLCVLQPS